MRPSDIARALFYPLTEISVAVPLVVFWLLLSFATWGGVFGLFLLFLIIPAVFRFQMIVLEARAKGRTPATPDVEFFNWFGNAWTLFPIPLVFFLTWLTIATGQKFGTAWAIVPVIFASVFYPASLAVLAITHSPLQSLNPLALARLWNRCGRTFWIATLFLVISSWLCVAAQALPMLWANLVQLLLSFSFFSVVGSLIEPYDLVDDVDIPAPLQSTDEEIARNLLQARTDDLNHAYGFISRDNREGGFKHVFDCISKDPDPAAAWAWFFEQMLGWENQAPALFFAQHYLHDQLRFGEHLGATKLIMRCRLIDEQFRPLPEDVAAAIAAAKACDNNELAAILGRH